MKRIKVRRILLSFLLILLAVLLLFTLGTWIDHRVKTGRELALLKAKGYCNPVSVGEYSLNVTRFGHELGKHTIVGLAGLGMDDYMVTARRMTAQLEPDNAVVFVDRAGYGLSDDTKCEMTLETVVEDYRTALKNAGVEPPFVLLAHSFGGVYATWWGSKYPDEIEAVVFLDGTQLSETAYEDQPDSPVTFGDRALATLAKLGFSRYLLRSECYLYPDLFTAEEQALGDALGLMTMESIAPISESGLCRRNARAAFAGIVANDVPKLYICASWGAETVDDLIERNQFLNRQIEKNRLGRPSLPTEYDDATAKAILQKMDELRRTVIQPYADKMGSCRIVLLPGEHMIYMQKPDACGTLIRDFLAELDAR